jgi:nitrite reductase/ring-hydroxylating ferredoxin subunit/uncharacterized membrane protein
MLSRFLTRMMDAQAIWTRPLGNLTYRFAHWLFDKMPWVRDLLSGRWLGHPLHALLTDAPIGILFLSLVFDVASMHEAAVWALVLGILAMGGAALAGFADYATTDGKARERATLHSTLMVIALVAYAFSAVLRLTSGPASTMAIVLSFVAFGILAAGAYVGGDIVYVLGNMVSRHAFRGAGTKWIALEPAELDAGGAIPEGRPVKAKLGINQLVLVRQGERILALHDVCAHAGGSLSDGKLAGGVIACPVHDSRFRMDSGSVVRGPSVYDQPAYEVRAREGGGWEARRQSN